MKRTFQFGVVFIALALAATQAAAVERPAPARAELLADVKSAKPGQTFEVGVLLRIDPGWHVYWENPGEAGAPTRVTLTAPHGVTVSPVQYPLPKEFIQAGDIRGYGYEGETLLIARVTVPQDWPREKALGISALVSWLSCKDVCLPGKAKLDLTVAVSAEPANANSELFAQWHPRLPLRVENGTVPFMVDGPVRDLNVRWRGPVTDVQVLPVPPDGVDVVGLAIEHSDRLTHVRPRLRLLGGEKKPDAALGLLVTYTDDLGQRRGVRLSIPLRPLED